MGVPVLDPQPLRGQPRLALIGVNPSLRCFVGCIQPMIRRVDFCLYMRRQQVWSFPCRLLPAIATPAHCQPSTHGQLVAASNSLFRIAEKPA